mmetsp:Transcript_91187/g.284171  ORF Transcript_91187/g.284171 Transcript_91187/m.284171 type:complete len:229 (+) Transcript_91187:31-717(+)
MARARACARATVCGCGRQDAPWEINRVSATSAVAAAGATTSYGNATPVSGDEARLSGELQWSADHASLCLAARVMAAMQAWLFCTPGSLQAGPATDRPKMLRTGSDAAPAQLIMLHMGMLPARPSLHFHIFSFSSNWMPKEFLMAFRSASDEGKSFSCRNFSRRLTSHSISASRTARPAAWHWETNSRAPWHSALTLPPVAGAAAGAAARPPAACCSICSVCMAEFGF